MVSKVCKGCWAEKPLSEYFNKPDNRDGKTGKCKLCVQDRQRLREIENGNKAHTRYRKTPKGYLLTVFHNMEGRVSGRIEKSKHLYEGLPIMTKDEFVAWGDTEEFRLMLKVYTDTGYDQRFAPSIDRIDTQDGYVIGNIRWLIHSENSSLGGQNRG